MILTERPITTRLYCLRRSSACRPPRSGRRSVLQHDGVVHQTARRHGRTHGRVAAHGPYETASVARLLYGAHRKRDLLGGTRRRNLHAEDHARQQLAPGVGQCGPHVVGVRRRIRHGALFDLPGLKRAVSERRNGYPHATVGADRGDLLFGNGEAHLDGSDLQQLHHRNARQHRLAGRSPPLADHTVERSVQRAVAQVLLGDFEKRLGLTEPGLRFDPFDFGQTLGLVQLAETPAGVFGLLQRRPRGVEGLPGRSRIEFGQQLPFPHALSFVGQRAGDGPGDGKTQGCRSLLLDRTYVHGRAEAGRRRGDDRRHPQRIGRPGVFRRRTARRNEQQGPENRSFHWFTVFRCKVPLLRSGRKGRRVG